MDDRTVNESKVKTKIKKDFVYNLLYQIFLVIVPIIVTPYVSRVLTPEGVGVYSFSYSLFNYFAIFSSLGFAYYGQIQIAKVKDDKEKRIICFWEIILCRLLSVSISLITNFVLFAFNAYHEYNNLMLIFSISIFAISFDITFFFQGVEEFKKIVFRNVIIKTLSVIAIFIFVKDTNDVPTYALIISLTFFFTNVSLWWYMRKYFVKIKPKELKPLRHLKGTILLFIPTIAITIYTVLDKTLIGLLVEGTTEVIENGETIVKKTASLENGYYEEAEKIIKLLMVVYTAISTIMIPRNANELSNGNIERVDKNVFTATRIVFLIGIPMMLGMFVIAPKFATWFLGEDFEKAGLLMQILSPLLLVMGLGNVFGVQYLIPAGKDKKFTIAVSSGALINIVLNLILIPSMHSVGAAIATVCAESVISAILWIMVRKRIDHVLLLKCIWKYIVAGAVMTGLLFLADHFFNFTNWLILIYVAIGALVYFLILLVLRESYIIQFLSRKQRNKEENDTKENC